MYIWVILAFFITTLFSYNLAYRTDIREVTVSPRAQSVASKVVIQHEAASRWVKDHSLGGDSRGDPMPQGNLQNDFTTREILVTDTTNELKPYLPFGYKPTAGPEYKSFVYCLDRRDLRSAAVDCNDEFSIAYLITYGCVAQKWVSLITGKPSKDLEFGISEAKKAGAEMGYVEVFPLVTTYGSPSARNADRIERLGLRRYVGKVYKGVVNADGKMEGTGGITLDGTLDDTYQEWGSGDYDQDYDPVFRRYFSDYYIMRGRAEPTPIPMFIGGADGKTVNSNDFYNTCVSNDRNCPFCLAYITSFR